MPSKLQIEDDPLLNELPYEEDYKKHFYGTVASVEFGEHQGKLVVFPGTTYPCNSNDVPWVAYEPHIYSRGTEKAFVSYKLITGVCYNDLAQYAPIPHGWYILGNHAALHVTGRINVQWKVGTCGTNSIISTLTKQPSFMNKTQHLAQFQGDKLTVGHAHESVVLSEVLARINTFGLNSVWCNPEVYNVESWDRAWDAEGFFPLGENMLYWDNRLYLPPIRECVAVRLEDGNFVSPDKPGKVLVEKEFGVECAIPPHSQWLCAKKYRKLVVEDEKPKLRGKKPREDKFKTLFNFDELSVVQQAFDTAHPQPEASTANFQTYSTSSTADNIWTASALYPSDDASEDEGDY